jgi:signal transduction histidine kinase
MGLESYLAVCLRSADGTHLGHLAVMDAGWMEAGEDDVAAMRIFASRTAAELERRQQASALRRSRARVLDAADTERRRVGRDLHDGAQQRLMAVGNLLRVAQLQVGEDHAAAEVLRLAHDELGEAHTELRDLARGLHPVALSERGLGTALESLTLACELPITLDVLADELPEQVQLAAYFIVSESLTNATKHAAATAVRIRVAREADELVVEIADDGRGGADAAAGTGLHGLADRIDALGGELAVDSPPGAGTCIRARLPLSA